MDGLEDIIASAERKCAQRGIRLTPRRKQVLRALVCSESAISAYELADFCNQETDEPMPTMSVYRILEFLQRERLAHKLETENKYIACSHIRCEHEHRKSQFLICSGCHKVEELDISGEALNAMEIAADAAGFKLTNPHFEFSGVCNDCVMGAS